MKDLKAAEKALSVDLPADHLPTLMQIFEAVEPGVSEAGGGEVQRSWHLVIASMANLLKQMTFAAEQSEISSIDSQYNNHPAKICRPQGAIFCGPTPTFSDLATLAHFKTWIFTANPTHRTFQLPPAAYTTASQTPPPNALLRALPMISLSPKDPLARERFCLIQTAQFCWAAVVGCDGQGGFQFRFSFEPETVQHLWQVLKRRLSAGLSVEQADQVNQWQQQLSWVTPHYRIPARFSHELLRQASLTPVAPVQSIHHVHHENGQNRQLKEQQAGLKESGLTEQSLKDFSTKEMGAATPWHETTPEGLEEEGGDPLGRSVADRDVELLKVIAHEVRTPLTTIQTLTRLLLKRTDLPSEVMRRLESIYRECSGQIDRFGLIFRAMELTHDRCQALSNRLTPISLQELLEENLERWQTQASRRSLTLSVTTPKLMPAIAIRDPHLLDQVLTGLMEYLGHSLSAGSHIHLHVAVAGSQIKLQLKTRTDETDPSAPSPMLEAVGQLLMFQPETGGLSLSLPVTKHLFQALGGKLTVRKHHNSEVLTIFLPLGGESDAF